MHNCPKNRYSTNQASRIKCYEIRSNFGTQGQIQTNREITTLTS